MAFSFSSHGVSKVAGLARDFLWIMYSIFDGCFGRASVEDCKIPLAWPGNHRAICSPYLYCQKRDCLRPEANRDYV